MIVSYSYIQSGDFESRNLPTQSCSNTHRQGKIIATQFLILFTLSVSAAVAQVQNPILPPGHTEMSKADLEKAKNFEKEMKLPGMHYKNEVPDNFPLPSYRKNVTRTTFINSTQGSPTASLTIVTKDNPKEVFEWYQNTCKNNQWQFKTPTPQAMGQMNQRAGEVYLIDARKGEHHIRICCLKPPKESGTTISISWSFERK